MKARFAAIFASHNRAHWEAVFADRDACVTPVLSPDEAAVHPHAQARGMFGDPGGVVQPMPAPRFSRTPGAIASPPPADERTLDTIDPVWRVPAGR